MKSPYEITEQLNAINNSNNNNEKNYRLNSPLLPELWNHIFLSEETKKTDTLEQEEQEQAHAPNFVLGPIDFTRLAKTSKLFKSIIDSSTKIQELLRIFATTHPRLSQLQKTHLGSKRMERRIKAREMTVQQAIQNTTPQNLPIKSSNTGSFRLHAIELGLTPSEAQSSWLMDIHLEALRHNIPFEEIQDLTSHQVHAMLITMPNSSYITTIGNTPTTGRVLTRQDVINVPLTAHHISALLEKMPFDKVKTLSEIQARAFVLGFTEEDIQQPWLTEQHCLAVDYKFKVEEMRGLSSLQLAALEKGYSQNQIANLTDTQLTCISRYEYTVEQITHPGILKLLEENKNNDKFQYEIAQLLKNYKSEQIADLTVAQLTYISRYGCTVEQVAHPGILKLLEENKNNNNDFQYGIEIAQLLKNYKPEQIAHLTAAQLTYISMYGCSIEQATDPRFSKLFEENKNNGKFLYMIVEALRKGCKLEEIENLTATQVWAFTCTKLTFEQITHPNFSNTLIDTMQYTKYDFETLINLQPWQLLLVQKNVPLEEVMEKNKRITPVHVLALQMTNVFSYDAIKNLNGKDVFELLTTPFVEMQPSSLSTSNNNNNQPPLLLSKDSREATGLRLTTSNMSTTTLTLSTEDERSQIKKSNSNLS